MSKDNIPPADAEFNTWLASLVPYVMAHKTELFVPDEDAMELSVRKGTWDGAYATSSNPATATHAATSLKNTARESVEVFLRPRIRGFKSNPAITPDMLLDMGLHVNDTTRTRVPAPSTWPLLELGTAERLTLIVKFHDSESPHRAKPDGVSYCELQYKIGGPAPTSPADFIPAGNPTRSPFRLDFDMTQVGQIVYLRARWVNSTGQPGPWSEIANSTIPG